MSDAFRPSPKAILDLGNAVSDFFFTVADKMDAAEATTQFNNGQESLRRSTNQFYLGLQGDPNWKGYQEKGAKFVNDQNQLIDKLATNPRAKQALQQWWMSQRDSLEVKVGQAAYDGRSNETLGTATKSINGVMQDVVSGTLDAESAKAKLRVLQNPLVQSNLVDKDVAEDNYKKWDHTIDVGSTTHQAFSLLRQKTADGLPNFQAAHDFLSDPKNTPGLSDVEVEQIDNRITHLEAVQDSEDKRTNDKLEGPLGDMYSKVMTGDATLGDFKSLIQQSRGQWAGKEKGERDRKWSGYYESEIRAEQARGKEQRTEERAAKAERGGYDTETANDLQTKMWDPDMTKEQKFNLISTTPGMTTSDRKKLASSVKNSSTIVHDSAARIAGLSSKDANGNPGPLDAEDVRIGHAMLQETIDKKPDLTPDQIGNETDSIIAYLSAKNVRVALKNAFQGKTPELKQAEQIAAGMGPLLPTTEGTRLTRGIGKEETAELGKRGITATVIKVDQKGRPVFQDTAGNLYVQDAGVWHMKMRTVFEAGKRREGEWLIMP